MRASRRHLLDVESQDISIELAGSSQVRNGQNVHVPLDHVLPPNIAHQHPVRPLRSAQHLVT